MEETQTFPGYPLVFWEAGLQFASTILAGLVISFVATFYLKKRDEVTRVAGVILEKRVESQQEILRFFEDATYTKQIPAENAQPYRELLEAYELRPPWGQQLQYAEIFGSTDGFHGFQRNLEQIISQHKLWLDSRVRFHLQLIQAYVSWVNAALLVPQNLNFSNGESITQEEHQKIANDLLLIQGIVLDAEFKGLIARLETLMVDSIYHLNLKRSRSSIMRNGFWNRESKKLIRILGRKTLLGEIRPHLITAAITFAFHEKGEDIDERHIEQVISNLTEGTPPPP